MNVILLPTWANVIFAVALVLLGGISLSESLKGKLPITVAPGALYFAFAIATSVALAAILMVLSPPICSLDGYYGAIGLTLFVAVIATGMACCSESGILILLVITAIVAVIVFLTLMFCKAIFAAIWLGATIGLIVIGTILFFPSK